MSHWALSIPQFYFSVPWLPWGPLWPIVISNENEGGRTYFGAQFRRTCVRKCVVTEAAGWRCPHLAAGLSSSLSRGWRSRSLASLTQGFPPVAYYTVWTHKQLFQKKALGIKKMMSQPWKTSRNQSKKRRLENKNLRKSSQAQKEEKDRPRLDRDRLDFQQGQWIKLEDPSGTKTSSTN